VPVVPILTADILKCGNNLFVVGFASGMVNLYSAATGSKVIELSAHSRQVNALCCHPTKSIFATVGDDTFLNMWEVESGNTPSVKLHLSSRVADFQLVGVCFANKNFTSILATSYIFKTALVWDNVV